VTLPDIRGREQILNVHMRKIPVGQDVNPAIIARGTPGMSGADLANLCNEAALMAARRNARTVEMQDFEKAKDKIIMGPERKSMVMPEEERRNTAYHEAGHALIGKLLPKCDPVHKVTIIPRGRALGVTMSLPEKDRYSYDKEYMLNQIAMLFGGRIAEEVFMNQMTTGASNDFERATQIARDMVTRYGMSDALGPMVYAEQEGEPFLGRPSAKAPSVRRDHAEGGRRSASHHRRAVCAGAQADRRQQRQDARHGQGHAGLGNHRRRAAQRHHGRQGVLPRTGRPQPTLVGWWQFLGRQSRIECRALADYGLSAKPHTQKVPQGPFVFALSDIGRFMSQQWQTSRFLLSSTSLRSWASSM
jgi:hypothetical protein